MTDIAASITCGTGRQDEAGTDAGSPGISHNPIDGSVK